MSIKCDASGDLIWGGLVFSLDGIGNCDEFSLPVSLRLNDYSCKLLFRDFKVKCRDCIYRQVGELRVRKKMCTY